MSSKFLPSLLVGAGLAGVLLLAAGAAPVQDAAAISQSEMEAMFAKVAQFTQPGERHAVLQRFLGDWRTETTVTGMGAPEAGTAHGRWLMDGRWVALEGSGTLMGQPNQTFTLLGHDNFKQSFVSTHVSTMDTAMTRAEGDLTQDGRSLITYGTLDEYLTGEHDKLVKTAWRFPSDDEIVLEVHDLAIGEVGTKVIEIRYRRAK